MDILAPVGSMESLKAAILGGADAVYLGGKEFGARRLASNFTDPQLRGAVLYAHDRGVKVHVTANILIKEDELGRALSFIEFLDSIEVEAAIIQDRGLLNLIRDRCSLPLHASTQMGIHSPEGARWAADNGISRVILARELGLEEISAIKRAVDIEIEVFIHGALCYSVSGQCLFSSMVGGRSGNRGLCAQPCRMHYTLGGEEGYLLSTADLFGVESIPKLMEMGINCVKIEGRMRSPVYTYLASLVYKNAVKRAAEGDSDIITQREKELLEVAFNRGFTRGYLECDEVMQKRYPNSRGRPLGNAIMAFGRLKIADQGLEVGDGITLYRANQKVGGFDIDEFKSEGQVTSLTPPFTLDDGNYLAFKTKDRDFDSIFQIISSIQVPEIDGKREEVDIELEEKERHSKTPMISCYISSTRTLESVLPFADRVYFDLNPRMDEARIMCIDQGIEFVPLLPRISTQIPRIDADEVMVCTLGQLQEYHDRELFGHYSLNFFNSMTIPDLHQYTLSVELSRDEMRDVLQHYSGRLEAMAFGRVELMVTRDPSIREGVLVDDAGRKFPVYRDRWGYAHIMNCADLLLLDYMDELQAMGLDSIGLDLRRRDPGLCENVARAFKENDLKRKGRIKRKCGKVTAGHFLRGVT
ncbi:MAG: peptidase [Methanomassiliicoccales archaeon]|nr:peptidase [Methanomassiliicoccales archaeon]NYT15825.1 peptidase [Methanomassiliicoccales archaeon]